MENQTAIARVRSIFQKFEADREYQPVESDSEDNEYDEGLVRRPVVFLPHSEDDEDGSIMDEQEGGHVPARKDRYSGFEYSLFVFLGIAMLWAWNMFLASAPYFQSRFADNQSILNSFQPAITSIGCLTNLSSMLILTNMQSKANYPKRVYTSIVMNIVLFSLLCISTIAFGKASSPAYLAFTLIMVFSTSVATGLCQNGAFALASSFGIQEYTQGILMGQAVAGVLPVCAQLVAVLYFKSLQNEDAVTATEAVAIQAKHTTSAATAYFLAAVVVSSMALLATIPLIRRYKARVLEDDMPSSSGLLNDTEEPKGKVGMIQLYKKLYWHVATVFTCFTITMFFPVYTSKVVSVTPENKNSPLLSADAFIPLGFLIWNSGDFIGRLLTSKLAINKPRLLFFLAILRAGFLPLYYLCNIGGNGAVIKSDVFYLLVVQLGFGITNGYVSSCAMIDANNWVNEEEMAPSGSFMATNLVGGLAFGSLLSFVVK